MKIPSAILLENIVNIFCKDILAEDNLNRILKDLNAYIILFSTLEATVLKDNQGIGDKNCSARLMAVGSMTLFNRNPEMSTFQNAVGLVLDDGGATDEVIRLFLEMVVIFLSIFKFSPYNVLKRL